MRQHGNRTRKGDQVPGISGMVADSAHQALQIVDRVEIFPKLLSQDIVLHQLLYGV